MRNFRRDALTTALERRRVVQGTLLRSTIHMVSAKDYWLFLAAVRQGRQDWWRRVTRKGFGEIDLASAAAIFREELAAGPRRAGELKELLARRGVPAVAWSGIGLWVDMVRVPPAGTWDQRKADLYGLADQWVRPAAPAEAAGLAHVVRRYLGAFGPASVREIADWAGIPHARLLPVIDRLPRRRFHDEKGRELLDLQRAPLPDPQTPAPVRFYLGCDASGPRPAHPDPAGALPAAGLQHEDAAFRADLPGRWRRRRNLALRTRPGRGHALRAASKSCPPRGR